MRNTCSAYMNGNGVTADPVQAMKWYGLAAEKGEPRAQSPLGWMLWEGKGVPQDAVQAHMWINLCCCPALHERERVSKVRDFIASNLTPDQLRCRNSPETGSPRNNNSSREIIWTG